MAGLIYKPQTRKGPVFLSPTEGPPPTITLPNGQVITAIRGDRAGGTYFNEGNFQWVFPNEVLGQQGATLSFNGQSQQLANTNMSYRGSGMGSLTESSKGAIGDMSSMGGFAPTQVGQYGFGPANLMGMFPSPFLSTYNPIQSAPYKFTDVKKFAKQFGEFNRGEILKNYGLSKDLSLDTLGTELQSLQSYVPAASALKRRETAADNIFNQQQRTAQLDTALPGLRGQLAGQGQRAETYAQGRIPDAVQDRAYELGVRSAAADIANAGGFGARSSVARKASDLMSAEQRLKLSQYGDTLLGQNATLRTNIEMAPTEYSNAGQQINVMPSLSFSQLSQSNLGQADQATLMPTPSAFTGEVSQNQFVTSQEQATRTFNATNELQNSQFNASNQNQFALNKFGYGVSLAGAYAGAAQTNLNTELALQQQKQMMDIYKDYLSKAQKTNDINSIFGAIGTLLPIGLTAMGYPEAGAVTSILGGGGGPSNTATSILGSGGPSDTAKSILGSGGGGGGGGISDILGMGGDVVKGIGGLLRSSVSSAPSASTLELDSASILNSAGVYGSPQPGAVSIGVNNQGNPVYSSQALLKDNNPVAGAKLVSNLRELIEPLKVLTPDDGAKLTTLAASVSNPDILKRLDSAVADGSPKEFADTALRTVSHPGVSEVSKNPTSSGISTVHATTKLYDTWPQMSDAQKALGLAALGMRTFKTSDGKALASKEITPDIKGKNGEVIQPGLTVGDGLKLLHNGYNAYSLVKNWDQLGLLQQSTGIEGDATQLAATAKSMGLLGYGPTGSSVSGVTPETLQKLNATPASQYGVGALIVPGNTAIPAGYTKLANASGGASVIVPAGNKSSAVVASVPTSSSTNAIYRRWTKETDMPADNGTYGGSAMVAGLHNMKNTNPALLSSMVAAAANSNVKISDSNHLEYAAKLGGVTLQRLLAGKVDKDTDKKGIETGNVVLRGIDSKSMTVENYNKVMQNQRAMFAREGIKSKADGYQLANQAYAEGRLNDIELVTAHNTLDMIFDDNGYATAKKLMLGKDTGTSVSKQLRPVQHTNLLKFSRPAIKQPVFTRRNAVPQLSAEMG